MSRSSADPEYVELIAALRRARETKSLTQEELARLLGKPQSFVSKYEACERRLDLIETLRACKAIGVQLRDIAPTSLREAL